MSEKIKPSPMIGMLTAAETQQALASQLRPPSFAEARAQKNLDALRQQKMDEQINRVAQAQAEHVARRERIARVRTAKVMLRLAKMTDKQRRYVIWLWFGGVDNKIDDLMHLSARELADIMTVDTEIGEDSLQEVLNIAEDQDGPWRPDD